MRNRKGKENLSVDGFPITVLGNDIGGGLSIAAFRHDRKEKIIRR